MYFVDNRTFCGFWLLGLLNNASYVIMIAGAKMIDPSMIGLIYLFSVFPSFMIKLTGPYWFHYVSYRSRMLAMIILMCASYFSVAMGQISNSLTLQLFGIAFGAAQSGLGEASVLALSGFYNPSEKALSAWSSGTGFAGIFGYGWVVFFTLALKYSFSVTLFVALMVLPLALALVFFQLLGSPNPEEKRMVHTGNDAVDKNGSGEDAMDEDEDDDMSAHSRVRLNTVSTTPTSYSPPTTEIVSPINSSIIPEKDHGSTALPTHNRMEEDKEVKEAHDTMSTTTADMSFQDRLQYTLALWPYMLPLFIVYYAEYTMQSGVWAAMGFPVTSEKARALFYTYANWTYQFGVLISRSSGSLWTPTRFRIWLIPVIQIVFLAFSIVNAYFFLWYDWSIMILCFAVGLCGGAVYIGGFSLIALEVQPNMKEFSLAAASIADSIGISLANVSAIFLQKALYDYHNLND
jgi:battenin